MNIVPDCAHYFAFDYGTYVLVHVGRTNERSLSEMDILLHWWMRIFFSTEGGNARSYSSSCFIALQRSDQIHYYSIPLLHRFLVCRSAADVTIPKNILKAMVKIARKRRTISARHCCQTIGMTVAAISVMVALVTSIQSIGNAIDNMDSMEESPSRTNSNGNAIDNLDSAEETSSKTNNNANAVVTYKTPLAYGTKDRGERTAELVEQAIGTGFRHIVTGGHHVKHNETAVGIGWKASGIPREELFLQTYFLPFSKKHADFQRQPTDPEELPSAIEDQVRLSIETSLSNLQTDRIDAVLFCNMKHKIWDTDEIHKAWKVLEDFVDRGVIQQLGLTSVHDVDWFETFWNTTRIKPTIIQNRFHSNRNYDVQMQETFAKHDIWVQRFWLLNGSSGYGKKNKDTALSKGVTPEQLVLGFVMSMGSETCLVGTKSLEHMKDDIEIARCYPTLFADDEERSEYARKLGMKQPADRPLPGRVGVDFGNKELPGCRSFSES